MSARTPMFSRRSSSRTEQRTEKTQAFSSANIFAAPEPNLDSLPINKPFNLSGYKNSSTNAKKDSELGSKETPNNIFSFQKHSQIHLEQQHIVSPSPRVATPGPALQVHSNSGPGSGFRNRNIFKTPSLPTQQDEETVDRRGPLPRRVPAARFFNGQALDKITEVVEEEGDSGFAESVDLEILQDISHGTSLNKSTKKRGRQDDESGGRHDVHIPKRQRLQEPEKEFEPAYEHQFSRIPMGHPISRNPETETIFNPFGFSLDAYISEHKKEYEAQKQHWEECTMEEWITGGQELLKEFEEIVEFIRAHMAHKVMVYAGIDQIFAGHNTILAQQENELRASQESLRKDLGNLIGRRQN